MPAQPLDDVRSIRVFESRWRRHDAIGERTTLDIADAVRRKQFGLGEPRRLFEDRVEQVARDRLAIGQPREMRLEVEHVVQQETHVSKRGAKVRHISDSVSSDAP